MKSTYMFTFEVDDTDVEQINFLKIIHIAASYGKTITGESHLTYFGQDMFSILCNSKYNPEFYKMLQDSFDNLVGLKISPISIEKIKG